jgi:hypothetical protein
VEVLGVLLSRAGTRAWLLLVGLVVLEAVVVYESDQSMVIA